MQKGDIIRARFLTMPEPFPGVGATTDKQYPVRKAGNYLNKPVPVTTFLFELPRHPDIRLQTSEISCHEWLDLEYVAVVHDEDVALGYAQAFGQPGVDDQVAVLAVDGDEEFGLGQRDEHLELLLAAVTMHMDVGA